MAREIEVAPTPEKPLAWDEHQRWMADRHTARVCAEHKVQFAICGCSEDDA